MSDLIDTTEMYLRTILELEEEGTTPMRARIAERLHQSGPTVSQTVARMERDGLLQLGSERQLELTSTGRSIATRVMRKHRLAECMLVDILGMPWEEVHAEACRWEHVMSESVERRLLTMLGNPSVSPFGNPIPGLDELDPRRDELTEGLGSMVPLSEAARADVIRVVVRRISEPLQEDAEAMA
ncbi:MAG: metal-dependent transcriptional regulator, partial [Candidatus Nanopelagicales bacterium]